MSKKGVKDDVGEAGGGRVQLPQNFTDQIYMEEQCESICILKR